MKLIIVATIILAVLKFGGELPAFLHIPLPLTIAIAFTLAVIYGLKKA